MINDVVLEGIVYRTLISTSPSHCPFLAKTITWPFIV